MFIFVAFYFFFFDLIRNDSNIHLWKMIVAVAYNKTKNPPQKQNEQRYNYCYGETETNEQKKK